VWWKCPSSCIAEEGEYDEVLPQMLNIIDTQYGNADGVLSVDEWVAAMATFHADNTEDELLAQCNQMLATLQKNQRKGWRRLFIKKDAANLVMAARASGLTHIVFVRHANCDSLEPHVDVSSPEGTKFADQKRRLTNRGQAQCVAANAAWFGSCPTRATFVSSPAVRSRESATHMRNPQESKPAEVLTIESLHYSGQSKICEEYFAQRGHGPLRDFLELDGAETAFGQYAQQVCAELAIKFRLSSAMHENGTYLAVFGHGVFLNAVAYAVATAAGCAESELEALLDMDPGEAEGVLVPLYGGGVRRMFVPL